MAEVVFVTPNFGGYVREEPVGTLLLATILKNSGINAEILQFHHFGDINNFDGFIDSAIEQIFEKDPRIVSFYTRCDSYHIVLRIAERIKKRSKDVYVVFGGPQSDLSAEDTLWEVSDVDFICCGEGETTIVPFFSSLIKGTPDLSVRGLAYRNGSAIVKNPRPELVGDLDSLPMIDYSLLDFNNEGHATKIFEFFPVDAGRGCPFGCTYCSTKTFWNRKYRLKSAERIVEEIKDLHERFGATMFNFEHDMFTMNRAKVIRICEMLKEIGFPIKWRCSARMDCIDNELIDIMADAGLEVLFVGIETGSPRMQKLVQKNLKLDDVPDKLEYISKKGVSITASFIFGFPNETEEDFSQTIALMTKIVHLPNIHVQRHLFSFFAGTELTMQYGENISRSATISDATGEHAVRECADIINAHPKLFPHFYEFKTDLREKAKYYPKFFSCWKFMRPVYEHIAKRYEQNRLCDMLYEFSDRNRESLEANLDWFDVLKQDKFIDAFGDDEKYSVMKEVSRYLLWETQARVGAVDIFEADIKALKDGKSIAEIDSAVTIVSVTKGDDNNNVITFNRL